jgi:hypothetical protein
VSTDVSEGNIASIFRVEEISSASKQMASRIICHPEIRVYTGNRR